MGEIGKNMFAFKYEDEIMLVDGGLAFPDADMLGVDIIVPRIDWVVEHAHMIKGWILTHGHEDHIGGLPYMLRLLPKIPMYGAKLTLGLLRGKFEEFKIKEADVEPHRGHDRRAHQDRPALHRRPVPHDALDPRQLAAW
jgi:ribonuclease J